MIFLPFHSAILEPDFYLSLTEGQSVSYFDPPTSGQIAVIVEFFLQLQHLLPCVCCPCPFIISIKCGG